MKKINKKLDQQSELAAQIKYLQPLTKRAFLFGMIASLLVLFPTMYMFEVYDRVVNSRSHETLLMLTILVLFGLGVMEMLEWARSETMREAGETLERKITPRIYRSLFKLNMTSNGRATVQPFQDLKTIREFLTSPALSALPELPSAVVFAALIFVLSPLLGVVALAAAIVQVALGWANEVSTQPPLSEANRKAIEANIQMDAMLRNSEIVRAMGMRPAVHKKWYERQLDMLAMQALASDRAGAFQAATKFVQTTMGSALLGIAAWLVLHDSLRGGPGMIIVGSVLGGRVLAPLVQAVTQWRSVVSVRDAWGRLSGLLNEYPVKATGMSLPQPRGHLSVESLVAGAPGGGTPILRGLQFSINPGDALAVVGPSASGKTTLAKLIVGVWPTMTGNVRLDGSDVYAWDKAELGPFVGYLPQGVELIDGTIAQNICRFDQPNFDKLEEAAKAVGLHEWIMSLPLGYETQLGMEGTRVSGGQRQRIGLARALYGDPVLVVLDEPNSSLDENGDKSLADSIVGWRKKGTVFVVITHRTSVLPACTHMLVLRGGVQQAFGVRDEVLASLRRTISNNKQSGEIVGRTND